MVYVPGTTLKLYLPRFDHVPTGGAVRAARPPRAHGAETILVVEDESAVRRVTASMLTGLRPSK